MSQHEHANVRLEELLHLLREGKILEAMGEFYADNVVMEEPSIGPTKGREANISREKQFMETVKDFRGFQVSHMAIGPNTGMYECTMDWTGVDGKEYHVEEVAVQTWKNGKIVHERFYYHA